LARLYNLKKQYDNELKEIKKQQDKIDSGEIKVNAETQKNLTDKLNDILVKTADNNDKIEESEEGLRKRRGQGLSQETKDAFAYVDSVLSGAATIAAALEENADREIEIRERRVDKAMEIASRGNAEALQIEEERLRKAQKQKEKAARAQMAINLAQQLSAATLAIAEAAASGAGWASVALVAAVIAALASGYSAVSSMNQEPVGYATGVVGLNGQGTGTSDSIPAMLSKGESVITAKGTGLEDNAEILKMMNNGVGFKMPKLKDSTNFTTNNTQSMSTKNLEQKLDRVISAVENIKESSVVIDENGMVAMSRAVEVKMRRRDKL
jgi:hypothetical protein